MTTNELSILSLGPPIVRFILVFLSIIGLLSEFLVNLPNLLLYFFFITLPRFLFLNLLGLNFNACINNL